MTNREWLSQMSDDDLADWLCEQIFSNYYSIKKLWHGTTNNILNMSRHHTVRNFLMREHVEEIKDDQN